MDNKLIIILVIVLIIAIFILIAVLAYFGHRFLKLRELEAVNKRVAVQKSIKKEKKLAQPAVIHKKVSPEVLKSLRAKKETAQKSLYCVDHPDEFANGKCAISGESYCAHCLTKQGDVRISRKYLDLYLDNEWEEVKMIPNNEDNKDIKTRILKMKNEMWESESLPVIIQEHYKINVEQDEIEEYTVVLARVEDKDYVTKELSFIK